MKGGLPKPVLFVAALALMAALAGTLAWLKAHQRLGAPGVIATAIPGEVRMQVELPAHVLDYVSTNLPEPERVASYLPPDTSYAGRYYSKTNDFEFTTTLVLMGADRTSLHRPDFCLSGQGWQILGRQTVTLPIGGAKPYGLTAGKWMLAKSVPGPGGTPVPVAGIYVFWYVAENQMTPDFSAMVKSMFYNLVRHGTLQRWAYVYYFTACVPGQEDAAFARLKAAIAVSVPEFQRPPAGGG